MSKVLSFDGDKTYVQLFDWPCFCQCGDNGVVLLPKVYWTAFFEAFPETPATFIRGEGKTIAEAECDAWNKYQRIIKCDHPAFERRGYENGAGFCVECGMFLMDAFEPCYTCAVCGKSTTHFHGNDCLWYCEEHSIGRVSFIDMIFGSKELSKGD